MKISFNTIPGNLTTTNGYGYAGFNMIRSLQQLGHEVPFQDHDADVEIFFSQPTHWEWTNPEKYHIGYTPWESTALPPGWLEGFNNNCDELWTPSPIIAQWYQDAGVTKPIHIYEHGIDASVWTPRRRRVDDVLRFLHIGEPAPRKGGAMALQAFRDAFGNRDDVHLTIKAHHYNTVMAQPGNRHPDRVYSNVSVIKNEYTTENLVHLVQRHHALVYPSYGEGFGLIPLQAMATGMPTICTEAWAPYARFISHPLPSTLGDTLWEEMHPGKLFHPDYDSLVDLYRQVADNYSSASAASYAAARRVAQEYSWVNVTETAFKHIVEKFTKS